MDWDIAEKKAEESLSALGTVMQRVVGAKGGKAGLSPTERSLLHHAVQQGLSAPDFYAVRKLCELADWSSPALLCLLLCEQLACRSGSTYLSTDDAVLLEKMGEFGLGEREARAVIEKVPNLPVVCGGLFSRDPSDTVPFILTDEGIYRQSHFISERKAAGVLLSLQSRPWRTHKNLAAIFEDVTEVHPLGTAPANAPNWGPVKLAPEQQLAALVAVQAPFTVIAGGPGTGKTSIVVTILRMLSGMGVSMENIALAAPTGRAANRMGEAIRKGLASIHGDVSEELHNLTPRTLHRLLGWSPSIRGFRYNEQNPIEADWLIVDEGSMIDLSLMESLLIALKPEAKLILLGDAYQLPSVEAGAVFRDLTTVSQAAGVTHPLQAALALRDSQDAGRHVIRLAKSFRQKGDSGGRHILSVAGVVKTGQTSSLFENSDQSLNILEVGQSLPLEGVSLLDPDIMDVGELTGQLYARFFESYRAKCRTARLRDVEEDGDLLRELFEMSEKLRLLCLTHGTRFGVGMFNRQFADRFSRGIQGHAPGMPWMVTRNDYRLGLYNGDIGIGLPFGPGRQHQLVFRNNGGFKALPFESVSGLEQAFAMTVHKSQGSETDHVALILPEAENGLCRREVIYTALTRAKKSVLIYGSRAMLEGAVLKVMERVTGLAGRLHSNSVNEKT